MRFGLYGRMTDAPLFSFAQFELPGRLGLADGRYLIRSPEGAAEHVVVIESAGAPPAGRRRRRRPRPADPQPDVEPVPLTRATVVRAGDGSSAAEASDWLAALRRDPDQLEAFQARMLAILNRALHVQRAAAMDPYVAEVPAASASAVRVGYGAGAEVATGRWTEALEVPRREPRHRRADALRPQERVAAVLAGRERVDACETLLLRARLDLDEGRRREAALQLGAGLDALLAEVDPAMAGEDQERDLANLAERRDAVAAVASAAAVGGLDPDQFEQVSSVLTICERVLRRRRILGA
jgi:hypothetical protein